MGVLISEFQDCRYRGGITAISAAIDRRIITDDLRGLIISYFDSNIYLDAKRNLCTESMRCL